MTLKRPFHAIASAWTALQAWIEARIIASDCWQPITLVERLHRAADGCPLSCDGDTAALLREAARCIEEKG